MPTQLAGPARGRGLRPRRRRQPGPARVVGRPGLTVFRSTGNGNRGAADRADRDTRTGIPAGAAHQRRRRRGAGRRRRPGRCGRASRTRPSPPGWASRGCRWCSGSARPTPADAVRIRWPDGVPQAELNLPAGRVGARSPRPTASGTLLPGPADLGRRAVPLRHRLPRGRGGRRDRRPTAPAARRGRRSRSRSSRASSSPRDGQYVVKVAEPMDEVLVPRPPAARRRSTTRPASRSTPTSGSPPAARRRRRSCSRSATGSLR